MHRHISLETAKLVYVKVIRKVIDVELCRHAGEPCSTGGWWKSKSPLTLTAGRLDGVSKNHLLPLLFPKLPFIHSSGRKLLACAYAHFYRLFFFFASLFHHQCEGVV